MIKHLLILSFLSPVATMLAAETPPPNIVIMLVDDMGIMDTSLPFLTDENGKAHSHPLNQFYRTPSMEKLASRGTRCNNFMAMSVCSPTRTSIMTGQNAARHHTTNWINPQTNNKGPNGPPQWNWRGLDQDDTTLPKLLAQQGYETIHVGKGHFGPNGTPGSNPKNIGFTINIGGDSFGQPGSYYGKKNYRGSEGQNAVPHLDAYHGTDTFLTEALTIEANRAIATAVSAKKPFFLYFAQYAVHSPFDADPRFVKHYLKSGKNKNAQAFASLIEGMDESLGKVLEQLEKSGVAENTLVIFLGDNGSDAPLGGAHEVACAAPLRGKKGSHYEGGMRVPFIAAWAKGNGNNPHQKALPIAPNFIQKSLSSVCDIFPTVVKVTGTSVPANHTVDGMALHHRLNGKSIDGEVQDFLMHYPHAPHRSDYFTVLRDDEWKVVYHCFPKDGEHYQLFHLTKDPYESKNIAAKNPEKLKEMMKKLIVSLEQHQAQYPVKKNDGEVKPVMPK